MTMPALAPVTRQKHMPLAYIQEAMLNFLQKVGGTDESFYNLFNAVSLKGRLDLGLLEQALNIIVGRHEVFRTTFGRVEDRPVQVIGEPRGISLQVADLRAIPASEREASAHELALKSIRIKFDIRRDVLLRAHLLRLTDEECILVLVTHHIISDGWSMRLLLRELVSIYAALSEGKPSPLPELPLQYADYAYWQRQWTQGQGLEEGLSYWRRQLRGWTWVELPFDHPRPAALSLRGAQQTFDVSEALTADLKEFSRRERVSLFMTMLAAFKALLFRYSGQEDILVNTPGVNRTLPETQALVGYFVTNLLLRTDLSGDPTFRELVRRVEDVTLDAYDNQDTPLLLIMQDLQMDQLQVMFSFTPLVQEQAVEFAGLTLELLELDATKSHQVSKRDMSMYFFEKPDTLTGVLQYSTDLFEHSTIGRMVEDFNLLVKKVMDDPDQPISSLRTRVE